jgi:hypothetical protein
MTMRTTYGLFAIAALALAGPALASDLNIAVQTDTGASSITVPGGATVNYQIVGTLSDTLNDGLALWGADLGMTGPAAVALSQANVPVAEPMAHFVCPQGINNPPCATGYGGTVSGNNLLQVGGGQNTIRNTIANAPFPISTDIVQNVAQSQQVLATGSVTMPLTDGPYTLAVSNVFANIVNDNTPANPTFYPTTAAGIGTVTSLTINVGVAAMITAANPPTAAGNPFEPGLPYRDVLDTGSGATATAGIGAAGTSGQAYVGGSVQYSPILVTFNNPVTFGTADVSIACTRAPCPTVTSASSAGNTTTINLSGAIPPLGCTTLTIGGTNQVQYRSNPGNVTFDSGTNTQDLLGLVQALNNGQGSANPARYNINRDGFVNTQDLLRLVQLLNGVSTTHVFATAGPADACP